jgi:site-specific recombinase XerD
MADATQALTTIVDSTHIDLAIAGWLEMHSRSQKTVKAYADTIQQFRLELAHIGHDLDSDVRTLALVAQRFASSTRNPRKEHVRPSTKNLRLAILSSFYEYALARYLLAPMDDEGHILNPLKIMSREKIEPYQGIHWLEPEEAEAGLRKIDRSTLLGKRNYALLAILLQTGRRLKEVTSLEWQHVRMKGQRVSLTFEHCKGDKTMRDTLNLANSKALLTWLHGYYGRDLNRLDKHAPLWVTLSRNTQQRGQPLGIQGIQQVCQKYLETHTHVTRHTFTQLMMKAGATLPEIQARLGHESLATTGIYARVFTSDENPHADRIATLLGVE